MENLTTSDLIKTIRENEKIQTNFFEIEKTILNVHTINNLVTTLLQELTIRFNLLYTGIMFIEDALHLGGLKIKTFLQEEKNISSVIIHKAIPPILKNRNTPLLSDKGFHSWNYFFPKTIIQEAGSVAVIPLILHKVVIGSLNLADINKNRYQANYSTFFLERLATIISICVDNVLKHEQVTHLSMTDPLTGLANRRLAYQILEKELTRAKRYGDSLALLYIDLDDFKKINDTHGHDVGDLFLKHVAKLLKKECRDFDCVSRLGGDEFLIVLCRSDIDNARIVKKRIHHSMKINTFSYNQATIPVQFSVGLASFDSTTITSDALIKRADQALYQNKKKRKRQTKAL